MKYLILIFLIFSGLLLFAETDVSTGDNLSTKGLKVVKSEELDAVKATRDLKKLENVRNSKRWAIVIGINEYDDKFIAKLSKAQNDAKVLSDILKNEGQFDFVYTYTDDNDKKSEYYPSLNNIVAKMDFLKSEIKPDDTVLVSFSGHGLSDDQGRSFVLMADTVISQPYKTSLPLYEIENWIKEMKVNKNIVLLDACRNVIEKTKAINTKTLIEEKSSQAEISAVVYATSPGEFSYEHDKDPYGVFTSFVVQGLRGSADENNDTIITFNELRNYVEKGVSGWALEHNKKQKPYTSTNGEFYGDVALSVIPLKERAKYNPFSYENSFKMQMNTYYGVNITSIATMSVGLVGGAVGGILFGVGYSQYSSLKVTSQSSEFDTYKGMTNGGFYTMITLGSIGLCAAIPLGISFGINPKNKKKAKIAYGISINPGINNFGIGVSLKF